MVCGLMRDECARVDSGSRRTLLELRKDSEYFQSKGIVHRGGSVRRVESKAGATTPVLDFCKMAVATGTRFTPRSDVPNTFNSQALNPYRGVCNM